MYSMLHPVFKPSCMKFYSNCLLFSSACSCVSVCSIYLTRTLLTCIQVMDYGSLPHFCKREGSGSSRHSGNGSTDNCFSLDHAFHQQIYNFIKQQALSIQSVSLIKQGSIHVEFPEPDPEDGNIMKKIETEFHRFGSKNGLANSLNGLKVNGDWLGECSYSTLRFITYNVTCLFFIFPF